MRFLAIIISTVFLNSSCDKFNIRKFNIINKSSFDIEVGITLGLTKTYYLKKKEKITFFQYADSERDQILDIYPTGAQKILIILDDGRKIEETYCDTLKNSPAGCKIEKDGFFSGKYFEPLYRRKNIYIGYNFIFTDEFAKTAK